MDPISIVVGAIVAGAAAGLKPTAENIVKDAYSSLRGIFLRKFPHLTDEVNGLEKDPSLPARAKLLEEVLKPHQNEVEDPDLLEAIKRLTSALQASSIATEEKTRIADIEANAEIVIRRVRNAEIERIKGDKITIEDVGGPSPNR